MNAFFLVICKKMPVILNFDGPWRQFETDTIYSMKINDMNTHVKAMNAMDTAAMIVQYEDDEEPESFYSDVKSLSFDERQQLWLDEVMSTVCQAKIREETKATTRTTNFAELRKLDERGYCKTIFPTRHENPIRRYCLDLTTTAEITNKAGLSHERQLVACRIVARTNP